MTDPAQRGRRSCLFCGEEYTKYEGPGPVECHWFSRLHYRLFGSWPRSVVNERLDYVAFAAADFKAHVAMRHILQEGS